MFRVRRVQHFYQAREDASLEKLAEKFVQFVKQEAGIAFEVTSGLRAFPVAQQRLVALRSLFDRAADSLPSGACLFMWRTLAAHRLTARAALQAYPIRQFCSKRSWKLELPLGGSGHLAKRGDLAHFTTPFTKISCDLNNSIVVEQELFEFDNAPGSKLSREMRSSVDLIRSFRPFPLHVELQKSAHLRANLIVGAHWRRFVRSRVARFKTGVPRAFWPLVNPGEARVVNRLWPKGYVLEVVAQLCCCGLRGRFVTLQRKETRPARVALPTLTLAFFLRLMGTRELGARRPLNKY